MLQSNTMGCLENNGAELIFNTVTEYSHDRFNIEIKK